MLAKTSTQAWSSKLAILVQSVKQDWRCLKLLICPIKLNNFYFDQFIVRHTVVQCFWYDSEVNFRGANIKIKKSETVS